MSTRSNIGILEKDGKVHSIYCHWDGYIEYVGWLLQNHYRDEKKIRQLLALGGCSSLREKLSPDEGTVHTFENPQEDVSIFYGRDRHEEGVLDCKEDASEEEYLLKKERPDWSEFAYLWKDGKWVYSCRPYGSDVDYESRSSFLYRRGDIFVFDLEKSLEEVDEKAKAKA